jgi:hypothetical protein
MDTILQYALDLGRTHDFLLQRLAREFLGCAVTRVDMQRTTALSTRVDRVDEDAIAEAVIECVDDRTMFDTEIAIVQGTERQRHAPTQTTENEMSVD